MEPTTLLVAAGLFSAASLLKKKSSDAVSEPPEYAQVRAKVLSDLKFYFGAHVAKMAYHADPFDVKMRTTISNPMTGSHNFTYLSNALEWAGKCNRVNGVCPTKAITPHISDDQIINNAASLVVSVVWYFFPNASPTEKANFVLKVMKETSEDVKNTYWMKILPYVMIAAAAITAGVAIAGAPIAVSSTGAISGGTGWAGTGTIIGTVGTTLGTTVPAGLTIAGSTAALTKTPKTETEMRNNLIGVFTSLDVIMKNTSLEGI